MPNPQNLKPFGKNNPPPGYGRPKGSRNRSTILREILNLEHNFKNPITHKEEKMEVEKAVDLALVKEALDGDITAIKEIKDSVYGKIPNKEETKPNPAMLSNEELAREMFERVVSVWESEQDRIDGIEWINNEFGVDVETLLKD